MPSIWLGKIKTTVLVLILSDAVISAEHRAPVDLKNLENLGDDAYDDCLTKHNVAHFPTDKQKPCVLACTLNRIGLINSKGTVDRHALVDFSDQLPIKNFLKPIRFCEKISEFPTIKFDGEDRGCRLIQCLQNEFPDKSKDDDSF